jgi:hypothetical protein
MEVGLDPNSKVGPIAYTDVEDIKSSLQAMLEVVLRSSKTLKTLPGDC